MDEINTIEELYDYVLTTLTSNLDYDDCNYTVENDETGRQIIHIPYGGGEVTVGITLSV